MLVQLQEVAANGSDFLQVKSGAATDGHFTLHEHRMDVFVCVHSSPSSTFRLGVITKMVRQLQQDGRVRALSEMQTPSRLVTDLLLVARSDPPLQNSRSLRHRHGKKVFWKLLKDAGARFSKELGGSRSCKWCRLSKTKLQQELKELRRQFADSSGQESRLFPTRIRKLEKEMRLLDLHHEKLTFSVECVRELEASMPDGLALVFTDFVGIHTVDMDKFYGFVLVKLSKREDSDSEDEEEDDYSVSSLPQNKIEYFVCFSRKHTALEVVAAWETLLNHGHFDGVDRIIRTGERGSCDRSRHLGLFECASCA